MVGSWLHLGSLVLMKNFSETGFILDNLLFLCNSYFILSLPSCLFKIYKTEGGRKADTAGYSLNSCRHILVFSSYAVLKYFVNMVTQFLMLKKNYPQFPNKLKASISCSIWGENKCTDLSVPQAIPQCVASYQNGNLICSSFYKNQNDTALFTNKEVLCFCEEDN